MTSFALRRNTLARPPSLDAADVEPGREPSAATLGSATAGRRIVLAVALIIALLGGAVGVSIWRYQAALREARLSDRSRVEQIQVQQASTHFWHERAAVDDYRLAGSVDAIGVVAAQGAAFVKATKGLGVDQAAELALVKRSRAANASFLAAFNQSRGVIASSQVIRERLVRELAAHANDVLVPLSSLQAIYEREAVGRAAAASSAGTEALSVSVIAGLIALLGGIAFAIVALRLVRRMTRREAKLQDLVAHVRATLGVLGGVSIELRSAAQESAAATTEQSAAVAETSATIEELAATATAIADNTRAVSAAAEQTGDTMRDMQEKVETIAERSLSLGESSQKIGGILELMNQIAEQTNLLALNAAIEAARAGDAGRGFAVVASEVRKLAERSLRSTESIREIIGGVQDETNATILATEQGTRQAREVGELMSSTAVMLEESILATQQQKSAADQVSTAMVQIREAAGQLAVEQESRLATAGSVDDLVRKLEQALDGDAEPVLASRAAA